MDTSPDKSSPSITVSDHNFIAFKDPLRPSSSSGLSNPFSNEIVSQESLGASTTLFSADTANPFDPIPSPAPSPPPSPLRSVPSELPFQKDSLPTDPGEIEDEFLDIAWELYQYEWNTYKAKESVKEILRARCEPRKGPHPNAPTERDYHDAVIQVATSNRYCQSLRGRLFGLKDVLPESSYLREVTPAELMVLAQLHVDGKKGLKG